MKIHKPHQYGDAYYCYKGYPAIVLLLCVDALGIITYINAGRSGKMGDAFTWNTSSLLHEIDAGRLLPGTAAVSVGNHQIRPFIVADSAFGLAAFGMKCYAGDDHNAQDSDFDYCVIQTRRVVENAIGRLKG